MKCSVHNCCFPFIIYEFEVAFVLLLSQSCCQFSLQIFCCDFAPSWAASRYLWLTNSNDNLYKQQSFFVCALILPHTYWESLAQEEDAQPNCNTQHSTLTFKKRLSGLAMRQDFESSVLSVTLSIFSSWCQSNISPPDSKISKVILHFTQLAAVLLIVRRNRRCRRLSEITKPWCF